MDKEDALKLMGLMLKANALIVGELDTGAAVKNLSAKLVIVASDASDNAQKRARGYVFGRAIPLITVPFTKFELSGHLGKSGCSMAAICDLGFAEAFLKKLDALCPGEYTDVLAAVSERLELQKKRKAVKKSYDMNKKRSLRRNNA